MSDEWFKENKDLNATAEVLTQFPGLRPELDDNRAILKSIEKAFDFGYKDSDYFKAGHPNKGYEELKAIFDHTLRELLPWPPSTNGVGILARFFGGFFAAVEFVICSERHDPKAERECINSLFRNTKQIISHMRKYHPHRLKPLTLRPIQNRLVKIYQKHSDLPQERRELIMRLSNYFA